MYIINENNEIDKKIHILRLENIYQDMFMFGYSDFNVFDNATNKNTMNYFTLLTDESIDMINDYYKKDFEYFSFTMIDRKQNKKIKKTTQQKENKTNKKK